ncbi:SDR family NAD(P)-dependent oxidoreductase [Planctomycetales bacterium ZRK34]|nr:SDR family NAD(P)-dependent oxidoreductase [Planctomycetales bacterium ZRK34]
MARFDITTTVALITGANRGIGRNITIALLDAGAARVYAGARKASSLDDLKAQYGDRLVPVVLDVTSEADVAAAVRTAPDVNLLINNAGVLYQSTGFENDVIDKARHEIEVNYLGVIRMTRAFAPVLKNNGGGTVVNIASIASYLNFPILAPYSASKAAVLSLSFGMRPTLTAQGTRTLVVNPGPIDTDMAKDLDFDTFSPSVVSDQLLAALNDPSIEAVFPDPMSQQMYQNWLDDPIAAQRAAAGELNA